MHEQNQSHQVQWDMIFKTPLWALVILVIFGIMTYSVFWFTGNILKPRLQEIQSIEKELKSGIITPIALRNESKNINQHPLDNGHILYPGSFFMPYDMGTSFN
jgi:hypothetical protein